ncbi:MAG: hypothetical protein KIT88_09580 [Phycisphaeraceae bacterium]|nr:hypothetical protein [Phycisphaeraceae bacterium]
MHATAMQGLGHLGFFKKIGDFFRKVGDTVKKGVKKVGQFVAPVVSVFNPIAGAIVGAAMNAAGGQGGAATAPPPASLVYAADGMGPPLPPGWGTNPAGVSAPLTTAAGGGETQKILGIDAKFVLVGMGGLLLVAMMRGGRP